MYVFDSHFNIFNAEIHFDFLNAQIFVTSYRVSFGSEVHFSSYTLWKMVEKYQLLKLHLSDKIILNFQTPGRLISTFTAF